MLARGLLRGPGAYFDVYTMLPDPAAISTHCDHDCGFYNDCTAPVHRVFGEVVRCSRRGGLPLLSLTEIHVDDDDKKLER